LAGREAVQLSGRPEDCRAAAVALQNHPTVRRASFSETTGGGLLALVEVRGCNACRLADEAGALVVRSVADGRGGLEWSLLAAGEEPLDRLLAILRTRGVLAGLAKPIRPAAAAKLTDRQCEVLRAAMEGGYFDFPRRMTQAALAKRLGISRVAALRILRRALRALASDHRGKDA